MERDDAFRLSPDIMKETLRWSARVQLEFDAMTVVKRAAALRMLDFGFVYLP